MKYLADKEGYTSLKALHNIYGEEDSVIHGFFFGIRTDLPVLQSLLNKAMDTVTIQEKRRLKEKWLGVRFCWTTTLRLQKEEGYYYRILFLEESLK